MSPIDPKDFFEGAKESISTADAEHTEEVNADEWNPTSPATLRGYFMKAQRQMTKFGPAYKCYIKDFDTELTVMVFAARKMLREGVLDASPKKGSLIVFDYQGQKEGKSGFDYHAYFVRAAETDPDYWAEVTRPKPGEIEAMEAAKVKKEEAASFAPDEAPF